MTDPDSSTWVCRVRKADGETCEHPDECLTARCVTGTCAPEEPLVCDLL
jgi:hypothetical protein